MGKHENVKNVTGGGAAAPAKVRDSNIELFRILTMLLIVAHHYVVNSGLTLSGSPIFEDRFGWRSIFLTIMGAWGKTGINCFVLITGYFMCTSNISVRKFVKLLGEVMFYRIAINSIFWICGYQAFSPKELVLLFIPIRTVENGFTNAFLVFYLSIPFLNVLVHTMTERQHIRLLMLCGFVYVFLGTIPVLFDVKMNYFSWFIVLYFIASYIRLYPKSFFKNQRLWAVITAVLFVICVVAMMGCAWFGQRRGKFGAYVCLSDSNTALAVAMSISLFMLFNNANIGYNRIINTISSSTFGVFLIHTCGSTMRKWLWQDVVDVVGHYNSAHMPIYFVFCVFCIFAICICIDLLRKKLLERPFLNWWDYKASVLLNTMNNWV